MKPLKNQYETISDEELALRYQKGEEGCAAELILRYEPLVKKLALACFHEEEREDLEQVLRLAIVESIRRFQPEKVKNLAGYLKTTLKGEQLHFFAMLEKAREGRRIEMWYTREELTEDQYFVPSEEEVKQRIRRSPFPSWAKEMLLILAEGKITALDLARRLGKNPSTVRVQLHRLRKMWQEQEERGE